MLLQVSQLNALVPPDEYDLYNVQDFLGSEEMGPLALEGEDAYFWGSASSRKDYKHDIVTLKRRQKDDAFSKWIAERAMVMVKCCGVKLKPSKQHGEVVLYDSSILKGTFWLTSLVASILPIASIVVLVHLKSQTARLGTIAGFNVLITLCLNIFTDAKRIDCFAVTAA
ncbi:hypothetical protein J1614_003475 [Plenodomus biglobosus]|nr:hypothetical protein J1614_003475 [Plenodomus biglobosus]